MKTAIQILNEHLLPATAPNIHALEECASQQTTKYKEALEDMAWQFGYRGTKDGKEVIHTGGLSALETAFFVLGWDDPHIINNT